MRKRKKSSSHYNKKILVIFFLCLVGLVGFVVLSRVWLTESFSVSVVPPHVTLGEPFIVQIRGADISQISQINYNNLLLKIFSYQNLPTALAVAAFNQKPGDYSVSVTLEDGRTIQKTLTVSVRQKVIVPLGIPAKLGGNSSTSATTLIGSLARDNKILANLKSANTVLWHYPFIYPVKNPVVTDGYGSIRLTDGYSIIHKGTDFQAPIGTDVFAMNSGIVRLAQETRTYGKVIVIDHGLGLQTIYMHLSKINVVVGERLEQGTIIGLSGDSGYTEGAHLHLSVRIGNISIDPMKFIALLGPVR